MNESIVLQDGRLLLRVTEAGAILGIGRSTVYELITAGKIEVVHIGRACRIPAAALDDFVDRLRASEGTSSEAAR